MTFFPTPSATAIVDLPVPNEQSPLPGAVNEETQQRNCEKEMHTRVHVCVCACPDVAALFCQQRVQSQPCLIHHIYEYKTEYQSAIVTISIVIAVGIRLATRGRSLRSMALGVCSTSTVCLDALLDESRSICRHLQMLWLPLCAWPTPGLSVLASV